MANALTAYDPQFWALESIATLTTNNLLPALVYRDFEPIVANVGDTVNTRKPGTFSVNDKSNTGSVTVQDASATNVAVVLNKHKEVTFMVTDRDMAIGLKNLVDTQIVPAVQAISKQLDQDLYAAMAIGFYYTTGTAATAPTTLASIANVRKLHNQNNVPFAGRTLVIGPTVEANFLVLDAFINKNYVGPQDSPNAALEEAILGKKLGYIIAMDQNVEVAIVQAAASAYVANGVNAKGSSSLIVKTGTGAIPAGAHFTLAGAAAGAYVVTAAFTSGANTWTVAPPLRAATADGDAITMVAAAGATYYKLPFFTRNAVALIVRPLPDPSQGAPGIGVSSYVINADGFSIRALVTYDANKLGWQVTLDCLYGIKVLDGELAGFLLS